MSYVNVIIPAFNEEKSIPFVLKEIPYSLHDIKVIVCDNASTDNTAKVARTCGAFVVFEKKMGYGSACLKAMENLDDDCEVVVFLDGDHSDKPIEMTELIQKIQDENYDMVIGSRVLGKKEKGALLPHARFGNWLSTFLISKIWNFSYTDLGPFRAIRRKKLEEINMQDKNYGWTIEMQIRALKLGFRIKEIPVSYKKRLLGKSKVSGTIKGTVLAGSIILYTIFKEYRKK